MHTVGIITGGSGRKIPEIDRGPAFLMDSVFVQNGLKLVRTNISYYNDETNQFSASYDLNKNLEIYKKEKVISPEIIWLRTNAGVEYLFDKLEHNHILIPDRRIIELSLNKYVDYLFLGEFMPYTTILSSFFQNTTIQEKFGDKIVLKPINSNGGKGIQLLKKDTLLENREKYIGLEKLFIVQEFKNFSNGYKNLIEGTHDIRLAFAGDEFLYCIVRQPKLGDFRSNISAGGSRFLLEENSIPNELWKLTEAIKQNIQYYKNSIFSLDFAFCAEEERWFLMESNYSPGMRYSQYKEHWIECFNKISLFFKEKIGNK